MLAELRMQIDTAKNTIGYYQSSNMQGVLMSVIASEYAAIMHRQSMRPYSQYVHGGDCTEWVVKTLSEEAYENIVLPLMDGNSSASRLNQLTVHRLKYSRCAHK